MSNGSVFEGSRGTPLPQFSLLPPARKEARLYTQVLRLLNCSQCNVGFFNNPFYLIGKLKGDKAK